MDVFVRREDEPARAGSLVWSVFGAMLVAACGGASQEPLSGSAPPLSSLYAVGLTASSMDALPECTPALAGATAYVGSPPGLWVCKKGHKWTEIKCDNDSAGAVAYASATKTLWACVSDQWTPVTLPTGPQGPVGPQGPAGANGASTLVTSAPEPAGPNCASGGVKLGFGIDADGNGALDQHEVTATSYVCNGSATPADGGVEPDAGPPAVADGGVGPDSGLPTLTCLSPAPGAVLEVAPGGAIMLSGTAVEASGVMALKVNGVATAVGAEGAFSAPLVTRYGLNHIELEATDGLGHTRRELCSFLVANRFVDEGTLLANGLMLRLGQAAVDDASRAGAINSLADLLAAVINSQGLRDSLHAGLLAANPLKPESCDQQFCFAGACTCLLSSRITYVSSSLPGPNTVSLSLVEGGIMTRVRFEDPLIRLRVDGEAAATNYDTTGDVNFDFVEVDTTYDLGLSAGRFRVGVRPGSVAVRVGSTSTNFSGIDGFIINIVADIADGTIRSLATQVLRDFVTTNFDSALDGIVSSLDVTTVPAVYTVPRFDGSGNIPITFGLGHSSASASAARLLLGVGTRFSAPASHARAPHGAPLSPFDVFIDPTPGGRPVAIADHIGVLQQALQAIWRGGGLDGTVARSGGATVSFATTLPPVVFVNDSGAVGIDLGGVEATVMLPGAPSAIHARAAVRASLTAVLVGEDVIFSGVTLDETHVIPEVELGADDRAALVATLTAMLADLAERTLNDAVPRLPLPAFTIPASLAAFGLPAGQALGIMNPALTVSDPHFLLRGDFGVR